VRKQHFLDFFNSKTAHWLSIVFLVLPIIIEALTFSGSFQKYFFVPFWLASCSVIIATALIVTFYYRNILTGIQKVYLLFFVFASSLVILLSFIESYHFPNYVFSSFHLHLSIIRYLPLFLGIQLLVISLRSLTQLKLAVFPLLVVLCFLVASTAFPTAFLLIGTENGLVETAQVIVLTISLAVVTPLLLSKAKNKQNKVFSALLISFAVFLIFLIGEEIAWGQQILQYPSLPFFLQHNVQKEETIHNLKPIQDILFNTYIIIGGAGSFGWIFSRYLEKLKNSASATLAKFIPPKWVSPYFLPMFSYGIVRVFHGPIQIKTWEEGCELLAYTGILLVAMRLLTIQREPQRMTWQSLIFLEKKTKFPVPA